jgi:hypothetical protein
MQEEATEPDAESLTRDVYAHFGLAYYLAECAFEGLVHAVATHGIAVTTGSIEERLKRWRGGTLGPLVSTAKEFIALEHHQDLDRLVERRNDLAHGFWFRRVHEMSTIDGLRKLVSDLDLDQALFRRVSQLTDDVFELQMNSVVKVSPEQWETALREARSGPPEAELTRVLLKPGVQIRLVDAWSIPTRAYVFEDAAGELWQLGDFGLDWYLGTAKPDWERPRWAHLFPATVVGRPKGAQPWQYTLDFSTGLQLHTALDERTNKPKLRWVVRSNR